MKAIRSPSLLAPSTKALESKKVSSPSRKSHKPQIMDLAHHLYPKFTIHTQQIQAEALTVPIPPAQLKPPPPST